MSRKEVQTNVRLPEDTKHRLDADPRSNKEIIKKALQNELGAETKNDLRRRIKHKKDRLNKIEDERREVEQVEEELTRELERLENRLESTVSQEEKFHEDISDLLNQVENGEINHLVADHEKVKRVATEHGETSEEVHRAAAELAAEENRPLSNFDFLSPMHVEQMRASDRMRVSEWVENGGHE